MNPDPDRDEARAAVALDDFLRARQAGQVPEPPAGLPAGEARLAEMLVRLAADVRPSAGFAGALEAQLRARAVRPAPRQPFSPRWAGALVLLVLALALAVLFAIPEVRAAVSEVLRIGAVRLFFGEPAATPTAPPGTTIPTPRPEPTLLPTWLDLAGETTLDDARRRVPFLVPMPAYPPGLGAPQHVFVQDLDGPAIVLVWVDTQQPNRVRMSLHLLSSELYARKGDPRVLAQTQVGGRPALWTAGPYVLEYRSGGGTDLDIRYLVAGHVLLWEDGGVTYRLETDLDLEEAVRVAESLDTER